jgi:adenylate cyclase
VIGGLLLCALLAYCGPLVGGAGGLLVLVFTVWGNYRFFFLRQEMVGVTYPLLTLIMMFMIVTLLNYLWEGRQRRFIRSAFSQYVSPQVVSRLEKNPDKLSLSGEQKHLTVFFSDIRNFTTIAEALEADKLAQLMNEVLSLESDLIMSNGGMVDKYIGDAVMAIWGAPLEDPAHPVHAVRAALQIMRKLREVRPLWTKRGWPEIDIGIGINSGIMSVGNFGSRQRIEYTAIGDAVNLASRLEGSNKLYGTNILISEATRAALGERFFCRCVDIVRVKGKSHPVTIYEPLLEGEPDASLRREVEAFEEGVRNYQRGRFDKAGNLMAGLYEQNPLPLYGVYLRRIEAFGKSPPPEGWDGVYTFSHK